MPNRSSPPRDLGLEARYGDAVNPEFVASLPLSGARWAVATVPVQAAVVSHDDPRMIINQSLRAAGFRGRIAVTAHHEDDAEMLVEAGATLVLEPFQDAADRALELISSGEEPGRIPAPVSAG